MQIIENILTQNPCYKAGKKIKVTGLMLHSVGCPQPSAEVFVKKWNNAATKLCVHAFIDGRTGKVYQTLPWEHRGWHCGGSGNNSYIGVEMCEPSCIQYIGGSTIRCTDMEIAKVVVKRTYDAAVDLFAYLCVKYELEPLEDGVIVSHKEGHSRGIASGHGDPEHLWTQLKTGCTMERFRRDVKDAMSHVVRVPVKEETSNNTMETVNENTPEVIAMPIATDKPINQTQIGSSEIKEGDMVTIAPEATYYEGKNIPSWVLSDIWLVKSIREDRVVIDKNVSGSHAICSPINRKYLIKVRA